MKKNIIIFISYVTISGLFFPGVLGGLTSSKQAQPTEEAQSPSFVYPNPVIPLPKNQAGSNDLQQAGGNVPKLTEEQKKCLVSFANKGMSTCLEDIGNSFVSKNINVRPECCSALDGVKDPCRLAIHFNNPEFEGKVKDFCSSGAAMAKPGSVSKTESGSAEGPVSESGFGDGSYPDMTGQLGDAFGPAFGPGPAEGPSPFGSLDGSYGPGAAEGPSSFGAVEEVGPIIEGSSSPSGSESSEGVSEPSSEASSPSDSGATEGLVQPVNEGSSPTSPGKTEKGLVGPSIEGSTPTDTGSAEEGHSSEGLRPSTPNDTGSPEEGHSN